MGAGAVIGGPGPVLLVIPDGAAERPGELPTSLDAARTPTLDALARRGSVTARVTTPPGLPAGSETGVSTLLGARLDVQPSRGVIEAAAAGVPVPPGRSAWRLDLYRDGRRFVPSDVESWREKLEAMLPEHAVHYLRGHRYLAVGATTPGALPIAASVRVWGGGGARLEPTLDRSTVIVCGPGAAAGIGALMGAEVMIPTGATGTPGTDLTAKAEAALAAIETGARRVVIHVAWPDEAAHERDRQGKVAGVEAIDRILLPPLAAAVEELGGELSVCPDHGTDPETGEHLPDPMPCLRYGPGIAPEGPDRLTEAVCVREPVTATR
jgi:2,3-bisphosphoglycerate-independent phosphoglycerate mutase